MRDTKDAMLLARLQAGDESALRDLAEAYGSKIYQLAFRYLRNKEDAEEVAQDVLFKVFRKVGDFRGDAALSSWIYRITFNASMSRLRTAKYQRTQNDELSMTATDGEEGMSTRHEIADWSDMADEHVFRAAAAPDRVQRHPVAAGYLPRPGDAARHPGYVHGRG